MLQAMHDSGCAKSVMRKDIFESIPRYKDISVNQLKMFFLNHVLENKKKSQVTQH